MMKEVVSPEDSEVKNSTTENLEKFKSDNGTSPSEAKSFADNLFKDIHDNYYTDYQDRIDGTPIDSENGHWEGERGNSKFIPSDETEKGMAGKAKLAEYGMDGLPYHDGEADYSKCSEATVKIENMSANRASNFAKADEKLAAQWNKDAKDNRTNWTDEDSEKYRHDNKLSWHECCDTHTMQLVSREIHGGDTSVFLHWGGVAECKVRDNIGGEFDE